MSLYDLPQSWETEETVALLMQLSTTQRRALRAYLSQVELGHLNVVEWLDSDPCPVSRAAWYRDGQRNYLNSPQFRQALDACLRRALLAQNSEEEKAIRQATRKLRMLVPKAVESLERIMQTGESDAVKLRAADSILDRAGLETAAKGPAATLEVTYVNDWRSSSPDAS